ncbi:retrotransposon gag domain, Retroviral aspartyl protease [Artemisia annua]|uniref:Retrotransposon gag domain, Retroviral aspartyl protease n=1 Tax=Artemisia annua TaxID=35608 RepID=A0A2U1KVN9_ARTAN|nr:retrotransposon gag domain, Retroviral aspartyl protease [Artemisia annua]
MVQTRNNSEGSNQPPDPVAVQLAVIAKKLEVIDALQKDVATLKSQSHNRSVNGSGRQDEGDSSWHHQSVKQTGTVQEYRQEFPKRSSQVSNWTEHCLLGSTWTAPSKSIETESKATTATSNSSNNNSKPPLRISDADRQSRYLKGECYRYGEKYGPGHWCKTGTLKVLEVEEGSEEQPTSEVKYMAWNTNDVAEISLHAIFGNTHPRTMKVQGMLHSTEVIILIDPGSTHNFISDALVKGLHLNTQVVARFSVQIGNGDFIRCGHICKNLPIQINELKIVQDFYPFSLGGADLVLGIQWLETLNTVQANWKEMFMIFNVDGKRYKWLGITTDSQNYGWTHWVNKPAGKTKGTGAAVILYFRRS